MTAYYNELDPEACAVLNELISSGVIAPGEVDNRSIKEVTANDIRGFDQCHFFAGAGVWSVAARLAGWPDDRPIWTASCPCQPFSAAGKQAGTDDPRHLWPDLYRIIRATRAAGRRVPVLVGEQVAGAAGYGWFDGVRTDLAREGFSARTVDIPACAVDAPHERNRLYWVAVADAESAGRGARYDESIGSGSSHSSAIQHDGRGTVADTITPRLHGDGHGPLAGTSGGSEGKGDQRQRVRADNRQCDGAECGEGNVADAESIGGRRDEQERGPIGRAVDGRLDAGRGRDGYMAHADNQGRLQQGRPVGEEWGRPHHGDEEGHMAHANGDCGRQGRGLRREDEAAEIRTQLRDDDESRNADGSHGGPLGHAIGARLEGQRGHGDDGTGWSQPDRSVAAADGGDGRNGSWWADAEWILCHDQKARRAKPGIPMLVDGMAGRIGLWRLAGNSIVPVLAAEVIKAILDVEGNMKEEAA